MNCSNCGHANDANAEFCENCGSPLRAACAQCGNPLKPGVKFCNRCGHPTSILPLNQSEAQLAALRKAASPEFQKKIRAASAKSEGERKPVTILFTDIVGSTSLAEKLDPEEWKEIVSGAHQRVSQAVYRYEGTIAQLLGDGVLAFFGAPVTHEDDPLRAVLAALDIQRAISEYERQLQGVLEQFQMRIGLNSGEVVVGSVGSDLHMEYLAIGDAVNLAARLQSAAKPGRVLISESTAKRVQAAFLLHPLGEITVKGKAEPVAVFEVVQSAAGRAAGLESRRGFEMLRSPLVGREAEIAALRQALEQLRLGMGQVVAITGEAGIGKSRLVEEARSVPPIDARWLEGRALSYGQKLSFWIIRQLMLSDLGLSDGDPEIKLRLALRKRVEARFRDEAGQVLPYLSALLGVQLEDEQAERVKLLDGETLKHQTLLSITRYFARLSEEQPTVLVCDDLHWADPSSLEALERLLPLTDQVPILLLLLSRLEREHPSWKIKVRAECEFAHRYTGIELKPLPRDEQNRLVDNLLAIADLPESVRKRILGRAEGNPLFLEEIVRHLVEQGAIVQEAGEWRASGDIQAIPIPETLRGVLLARIDRLQENVRHTLQLAAVIGKSFLYRLLEAVSEAEMQLEAHLAQLQRADLVREKTRIPELEYVFKHSLIQEAAYHSLLLQQRRQFHRQVGQALEALFAGREGEIIGLLAHHFDAAGESVKATSYLIEAGDQARLSDEHSEAVGYYRRAIELLSETGDEERCAHAWLKLGLVYHASFRYKETYQAYEQAFKLKNKTGSPPRARMPGKEYLLRDCGWRKGLNLDPGLTNTTADRKWAAQLFSGLAQVDDGLNVIPDVARSWQVLDGGLRYIFHLRDDVRWTDGSPVIAHDFEWAWKRNLDPACDRTLAQLLFDVAGAQAYHQGDNPDPVSVGIYALDDRTLEVRLAKPAAYFPYVVTMPNSFPLPRRPIERYGEDWWQPEHIVSNGAYRLVEFIPDTSFCLERNDGYHGDFPGNVHRYEFQSIREPMERVRAYQENRTDIFGLTRNELSIEALPDAPRAGWILSVWYILMNPMRPPLTDVRVRRALGHILDKDRMVRKYNLPGASGGIIPPGMPGHSPDLSPRYNPELAHRLLAEAGYPDGKGLPVLKATAFPTSMSTVISDLLSESFSQWRTEFGIEVDLHPYEGGDLAGYSLIFTGWTADYPDPHNFLRQSSLIYRLQQYGWKDEEYEKLIETAAHLPDRSQRMALYRQIDRLLVVDRALALPWNYSSMGYIVTKPWIKNYHTNLLGEGPLRNIIVEDH